MKDVAVIIDGNSLINRAFFGVPPLTTKEGIHTNAVYGFLNMLTKIRKLYSPKYMSVAFDLRAPTFRHKMFTEYKGTRKGMPSELREQMPIIKDMLDLLKIHRMELEGFEADDLIGTVANIGADSGLDVKLITGDKDALQLIRENLEVVIAKKNDLCGYTPEMVFEEMGVYPNRVIDYKGLAGDSSDNIPGIPSVGPKTAAKLLAEFDTVEELINRFEEVSNKRIRGLVEEYSDQALISKKLAKIIINVPLEFEMHELIIGEPDSELLREFYRKYEFRKLLTTVESSEEATKLIKELIIKDIETEADIDVLIKNIKTSKKLFIKVAGDKGNVRNRKTVALALNYGGEEFYFVDQGTYESHIQKFKEVLEDKEIKKYGHEIKQTILELLKCDINFSGLEYDSLIASYLLEPGRKSYDLNELSAEYVGYEMKSDEEILGKGKKEVLFSELDIEIQKKYVVDNVFCVKEIVEKQIKELKDKDLYDLFVDIELPLAKVLASIEFEGMAVDVSVLDSLDEEISSKIESLTSDIYGFSGEEFNINSPKQLGVILFEKLELPVIKKTKTGYSTSHDILMKLIDKHEIINLIMEYRTYSKLKSTYIDGLKAVVNEGTGRIHSSFNQTVAVTGRLSSTEPNMQNIPVRLEMGRNLRKVFIPRGEDYKLVDADYSQIELRVLAHMSQDPNLLKAFKEGIDVHAMTASQVFGTPVDEVTSLERSRAKEVNFGIVYGMSDFGLSENLKITRKEAKDYIEQYFEKYVNVRSFMDREVDFCREHGFVKTLLNRRRDIPEINNKNFMVRSFGERTAMNTPIQGTAADVIKIAMVKVFNELADRKMKSKLILQVHDELIIDTHESEIDQVKELLVRNMEEAYLMDVPLRVDMNVGMSWYETK